MTDDEQHLRLLAIFHYIVGGLTAFLSCFGLIHFFVGVVIIPTIGNLAEHLAGNVTLAEAQEQITIATRQYAKRQATWFRHQLGPEWRRLRPGDDLETTIQVGLVDI